MQQHPILNWNELILFPNTLDRHFIAREGVGHPLVTLREVAMLGVIDHITDKENWQVKFFDEEIQTKWKPEMLENNGEEDKGKAAKKARTRRKAEEVLHYLGKLPNVAILMTVRVTQRGVDWVQPFMEPLKPLSMTGSKYVRTRIAVREGENSEYATKLLDAVEGLPLAVTLIYYQDGNETPQSLWERWCGEHTRVIEDAGGVEDRLSKLDVSIELSRNSARMKANPDARLVLGAMAILPDGVPTSGGWIEGLQKFLSQPTPASQSSASDSQVATMTLNLRKWTATLLNVALIMNDKFTSPPRLRLLSPIRQYCLRDLP